jgi:4-amino-4-deoxychorismate lyase
MGGPLSVWLDGKALQAPDDLAWAQERGLHYGDGLFETMVLQQGRLRLAKRHVARLAEGCRRLGINADAATLVADAACRAALQGPRALVKLIVTRGVATARGYAPSGEEQARSLTLVYPLPDDTEDCLGVDAVSLDMPLGENPRLAGLKHLNRLELVLARQALGNSAFEGILCSSRGMLACGTMSNIFIVLAGRLFTPRVDRCGIAGVMRAEVLDAAEGLGFPTVVDDLPASVLAEADECFLTNARLGVQPVTRLDGRSLPRGPLTLALRRQVLRPVC